MGVLAEEMNRMSVGLAKAHERISKETHSKIAAIEQLRHADRLSTVGMLASGIAHELGTPLNVVEGHAQLICEDDKAGHNAHNNARIIITQTVRMTQIIRQLLNFARRKVLQRTPTDMMDLVTQTLAMVEPLARKNRVSTHLGNSNDSVMAMVAPGEIQQVLINILMNSIQAMPQGGTLSIEIEQTRKSFPDHVSGSEKMLFMYVSIQDTGMGMSDEIRTHIFEPFFTTKMVGEGTGLGLSVAHGIVQDHGGWIDVESEEGKGSRFLIYLPVEQGS